MFFCQLLATLVIHFTLQIIFISDQNQPRIFFDVAADDFEPIVLHFYKVTSVLGFQREIVFQIWFCVLTVLLLKVERVDMS